MTDVASPRFRFAPSPTGFFHVGGARTALYNWALAKRLGGTFVLRIEDTDEARNKPEWTQGIIDALDWIGVKRDDPTFEGPYFQSSYADEHVAAANRLFAEGRAYYCDLTSEQIQERSKQNSKPGYDGYSRDRGLEPGPGRVLRFRVPEGTTVVDDLVRGRVEFANDTIEDFVLLRGNGSPMFLLANVVDDVSMRVSHVVRAEEHLPNTPKQQMLWEALGHRPPVWAHVPVLVNEQRKKLSKRRDKVALEQFRDEGYLSEAMVNYLMTLGWAPHGDEEIVAWSRIQAEFRLEDVNHSPAFFDLKKLAAFNGEYIRAMSLDQFISACEPFLTGRAVEPRSVRCRRVPFDRTVGSDTHGDHERDRRVGGFPLPRRADHRRDGVVQDVRRRRCRRDVERCDRRVRCADRLVRGCPEDDPGGHGRRAGIETGQGAGPGARGGDRPHRRPAVVRGARVART